MQMEEWQDDTARCVQCKNEGGGGNGDCCASTNVVVAVAARNQRGVMIGCRSPLT